jgi:hypothetical protein
LPQSKWPMSHGTPCMCAYLVAKRLHDRHDSCWADHYYGAHLRLFSSIDMQRVFVTWRVISKQSLLRQKLCFWISKHTVSSSQLILCALARWRRYQQQVRTTLSTWCYIFGSNLFCKTRHIFLCPIGLVDIIFGIFSCTGYKYPFRGLDVGYGGVLSLRSNIPGSAPCATLDIYDLSVQGDFFQRRG